MQWWSPVVGGALIGVAATLLLVFSGRIAGVSGIVGGLFHPKEGDVAWRLLFVLGLMVGGWVMSGLTPERFVASPSSAGQLVVAGLLVGFGTRLGNGCTSGHGVCGVSRASPRSMVATLTFILAGALVATLIHGGGVQ